MMKATAKDLRFHTKELIDSVGRGEEVVVTFRGRPCAKLIPYTEPENTSAADKLFGIWRDNEPVTDVDEHVRNLRKGRF